MGGLKPVDPAKKKAYADAGYDGALSPEQQAAQPPPAQATPAAATPAPVTAPARTVPRPQRPSVVPTMPDASGATEAARQQVLQTLGAGEKLAGELYAPGSMGRVETPRMAETAALIKAQQNALGGMSPQEQEAARTNAIMQINGQANAKLRDISGRAAGNGLRGGVVAGENAQVAGASQGAYASALQELMGKVQKSQVDASSALGNTLSAARNTEGSAQNTNLTASAAELAGRLSTPFDYANLVDTATTNDRVETNAETGRVEKSTETDNDMNELEESTSEQLNEAADERLKTGRPGVDDAPRNVLARANGYSTFDDMPEDVRQSYANQAGVPIDDLSRFMSDPANKALVDKMTSDAKRSRDGG